MYNSIYKASQNRPQVAYRAYKIQATYELRMSYMIDKKKEQDYGF